MRIGIITGASSGLGMAYARHIDKLMDLDELWLIARREDRLQALSAQLGCRCRVLPMDLTRRQSAVDLQALLEKERPRVEVLICAAGLGKFTLTEHMTLAENHATIALNCRAAVDVTRVCLPFLGRGSRVLEICSSAAFQPLPGANLYAASKAFLLRYTRGLRWELADRGIKVTAVCPGWIRTPFLDVAQDTARPVPLGWMTKLAQRPESVAAWSMTMNGLNKAVVTCSPISAVQRVGTKLLPSSLIMALWEAQRRF